MNKKSFIPFCKIHNNRVRYYNGSKSAPTEMIMPYVTMEKILKKFMDSVKLYNFQHDKHSNFEKLQRQKRTNSKFTYHFKVNS